MKRRSNTTEDSHSLDEPGLEISSLIDVCFLLLIYFLVTTTIQPREQDLTTTVPMPGGYTAEMQPMIIELKQNGSVVVNPGDSTEIYEANQGERELPLLKERLAMLVGAGVSYSAPQVMIRVHNEVAQQRYIDVINCLAGAGIESIALME